MALDTNTDISEVQRTEEAKPEKQSLLLSSMKLWCILFTLAKCPAKRILPQDEHVSERTLNCWFQKAQPYILFGALVK